MRDLALFHTKGAKNTKPLIELSALCSLYSSCPLCEKTDPTSPVNRSHHPFSIPVAGDFAGRQRLVQSFHLRQIKIDAVCRNILFEIFPPFGAWNRYKIFAFMKNPGKGDLRRGDMNAGREIRYDSRCFYILIIILTLITGIGASVIPFRIIFCAVHLPR
jgi:hypothetical protein